MTTTDPTTIRQVPVTFTRFADSITEALVSAVDGDEIVADGEEWTVEGEDNEFTLTEVADGKPRRFRVSVHVRVFES